MKFRYSLGLTSLSAEVTLFLGRRLKALGELIAAELERSYAGSVDDPSLRGKPRLKLLAGGAPQERKNRKDSKTKKKGRGRRARTS